MTRCRVGLQCARASLASATSPRSAEVVGITERAVQRIVRELEEAGYVVRVKDGRQNRYVVKRHLKLRHPLESHREVGELIALVED